jgi:hypothetical protein
VKKAQKGGDIGKPGKSFAAVAKKAGGGEKGKKIAAAAMWKNAAHQAHESIEESQLDELSTSTLKSYLKKSKGDAAKYDQAGDVARHEKGDAKGANKMYQKGDNRYHGAEKAKGKIVDRALSDIDEATDAEQIAHDLSAHKRKLARQKNRAEITSMMSAEHPTKRSGEREQAKIRHTNRQLQKPEVVDEAKESNSKRDSRAERAGRKVAHDLEYDMGHRGKDDNKAERAGK